MMKMKKEGDLEYIIKNYGGKNWDIEDYDMHDAHTWMDMYKKLNIDLTEQKYKEEDEVFTFPTEYPQWLRTDQGEWIWYGVGHVFSCALESYKEDENGDRETEFWLMLRTVDRKIIEIGKIPDNDDNDADSNLDIYINEVNNLYAGFLNQLFNQEMFPATEI